MSLSASEYGLYLQTFCEAHRGPPTNPLHGDVMKGEHLRESVIIAIAISDASRKAPLRRAHDLEAELEMVLAYFREPASAEG
jgi:hypothetical protein